MVHEKNTETICNTILSLLTHPKTRLLEKKPLKPSPRVSAAMSAGDPGSVIEKTSSVAVSTDSQKPSTEIVLPISSGDPEESVNSVGRSPPSGEAKENRVTTVIKPPTRDVNIVLFFSILAAIASIDVAPSWLSRDGSVDEEFGAFRDV